MTKTTIEFAGGSAAGRTIRARVTAGLAGVLASLPVEATRARVAFADENGPKGGDAFRCALEVQLPRRAALHVESKRRPKKYYAARRAVAAG